MPLTLLFIFTITSILIIPYVLNFVSITKSTINTATHPLTPSILQSYNSPQLIPTFQIIHSQVIQQFNFWNNLWLPIHYLSTISLIILSITYFINPTFNLPIPLTYIIPITSGFTLSTFLNHTFYPIPFIQYLSLIQHLNDDIQYSIIQQNLNNIKFLLQQIQLGHIHISQHELYNLQQQTLFWTQQAYQHNRNQHNPQLPPHG